MENYFIGIDVSKKKLDVCLLHQGKVIEEEVVTNDIKAISSCLSGLLEKHGIEPDKVLFCAEHTGLYTYPLSCACEGLGWKLWIENPAQIKYCSGVQRGKNDKVDARKIAFYAYRYLERCKIYSRPQTELEEMKQMFSERSLLVSDRAKYRGQLSDESDFVRPQLFNSKARRLKSLIKVLDDCIKELETQIDSLILNQHLLRRQYELLCSIDGVGPITAIKMIVETKAFSEFKNPRKFCCHAGVAPFEYTSGSSIRGRSKLSQRADKSIKSILQTAAIGAVKKEGELRSYFLRKIKEGKPKMSVYNAVRAKLVYRMFAVIKNDRFYEKNYCKSIA